jgi:8-oxo-dGTP pyrophosphatase MutT (NUDIX family)
MNRIEQTAYGVVTVIKEEGEYKFLILFQNKEFNNWSYPKGKREEGETEPLAIAMRELEEESGITDIELLDVPLIDERYEFDLKGTKIDRVCKYFVGIVKNKSVKIQEGEILDYKWATFDEAKNTFGFQKECRIKTLEQAKTYLDEYDSRK